MLQKMAASLSLEKMTKRYAILLILFTTYLLTSCSYVSDFNAYKSFKKEKWDIKDSVYFNLKAAEKWLYNPNIIFRHTTSYFADRFWCSISIEDSTKIIKCDTVGIQLMDISGEWLGSGFPYKYINISSSKKGIILDKGAYIVRINQLMGKEELEGIHGIGVEINDFPHIFNQ